MGLTRPATITASLYGLPLGTGNAKVDAGDADGIGDWPLGEGEAGLGVGTGEGEGVGVGVGGGMMFSQ